MQNRIGGSVILNGADTQKMAPFRGTMQREGTMLRQTSGSKLLTSMQASQNKLNAFLETIVKSQTKQARKVGFSPAPPIPNNRLINQISVDECFESI